uniref:Secreted protein n=1 Tax=Caenorhabditis tropicalis TaxID=1561998 RepID=A0A1I7UFL1_9PELO
MYWFSNIFLALAAICAVSAQFYPWSMQFAPVDHMEPSLFYQPQQPAEPGLFNFIPSAVAQHTVNRPPTPLGWGKRNEKMVV